MPKSNEPIKLAYPVVSSNNSKSTSTSKSVNQPNIFTTIQHQNSNLTMNNQTNTTNRVAFTSQSLPNGTISITTQPTQLAHHPVMHGVSSASGIPTSTTIKTITTGGGATVQNQSHPHNMGGGATQTLVIKNQTVSLPAGLVSSAPSGLVTMTKAINQGNQANIVSNMLPAGVVMGVRANAPNQTQPKNVSNQPLQRVVIGNTHMVGTRPSNPGITLSTIQQSGPALILKTENGYQLLRVGPAPGPGNNQGTTTNIGQQINTNSTGNQTIRVQTVPASLAVSAPSNIVVNSVATSNSNQILSTQVNSSVTQQQQQQPQQQHHPPTVASVTPVGTTVLQAQQQFNQHQQQQQVHQQQQQTQVHVQSQNQSPQVQIQQTITSQPTSVQQQQQVQVQQQSTQQQQHHSQNQTNQTQTIQIQQQSAQQNPVVSSTTQQTTTTTVQQRNLQGNTKEKCRKFLANLIELSTREPKPVERNVRTLIQELIDSNVEPEEFCDRLERLLNASPQPCLIGFLKKSLPLLRQSLFTKELVIDGIKPPPQHVVGMITAAGIQQQLPRIQAQIRPIGQTQVRMVSQSVPRPIGQTTITKQTTPGVRIQGPIPATISGPRLANTQIRSISTVDNSNNVQVTPGFQHVNRNQVQFQSPQNIVTVKTPQAGIRVPSSVQIRTPTVRTKTAINTSIANATNITQVKIGQTQIKQITPVHNSSSNSLSSIPSSIHQQPQQPQQPQQSQQTQQLQQSQQSQQPPQPQTQQQQTQQSQQQQLHQQQQQQLQHPQQSQLPQAIPASLATMPTSTIISSVPPSISLPPQTITTTTVAAVLAATNSLHNDITAGTVITTSIMTPTSTPKIITVKAQHNATQPTQKITSKKKQLLEEKSASSASSFFQQSSMSTASSMYGDDDINDVAAMGGVNLAEESQKILGSTENIGTQIRSCKDEVFLHLPALQNKIKSLVLECGLEEPNQEVAVLISHACQERLKNIVEKLAVIAEHRIDVLKIDNRYEVTKDIRGQIKFLEELDKAEQKRHEEQEREMLFRAAKSRSKIEDPEQAKLKAKAKEMQRAEMEEIRHQESNKTALQAIGPPRKKTKFETDGSSAGSTSTSFGIGASGIGAPAIFRPRIKRVNLRDMLFFMEQERETCRSLTLYKSYLK